MAIPTFGATATSGLEDLIGFIGTGTMGLPMVRHLARAGYSVLAYDLDPERLRAAAAAGARAAAGPREVVQECLWVLTSLPSSESFVRVAEETFLPAAREGQTFIDLGTVTPPETRRLAALLREAGAVLVDAPVSGGPGGAENADLLMFVGGEEAVVERCRPLLETLTRPERITYCGPAGAGQVVKGVNQLMMGLGAAAYLEALAYGVRAGVEPEVIRQAIAPPAWGGRWRKDFDEIAGFVVSGRGEDVGVKFRELPYFLREAQEHGFDLPLTGALYAFCDRGERVATDDNRPAPSFWHELTRRVDGPQAEEG